VFERLKFPSTVTTPIISSNGAPVKSYAQLVNGPKIPPNNNGLIYHEKSIRNVGINSHNKRISPSLPGLLPFMRYSTFNSPDSSHWPNDSF
jgi:hypothetical protein